MIHEKTFKERLAILVGERGNKNFERRTGVSEKSLLQYLQGDSLPTLKILEKIAAGNGVSIGWLIGEEAYLSVDEIQMAPVNHSMEEICQWIAEQHDGINYWEVLKAKLALEYPDFRAWLREREQRR
jgi:transcriptional regulator with XRE-family HTH domain